MFHTAAYFSASLSTVANLAIPALTDDILTITSGNNFQLQQDMMLLAAFGASATLNRVRLQSASLRQINVPFLRPVNAGVLPADDPNLSIWLDNPLRLRAAEELSMEATSDIAMGNENFTGLIWVAAALDQAPSGVEVTARATSTGAAVANKWTTIAYTLDQSLPPGSYALVGSEHISTNAIAHRWIIPNQVWRPGMLSATVIGRRTHRIFYRELLGTMGIFPNTALPLLQVLCNAADAVHTIYMKLVAL